MSLPPPRDWTRRDVVKTLAMSGVASHIGLYDQVSQEMLVRSIPSTSEPLAAVGLGTWQTFDVDQSGPERDRLREVLRLFVEHGGQLVDSSPMYGRAESVVGDLATELGIGRFLFYATKVWTRGQEDGIAQMRRSLQRMRVQAMDLMQVHNLVDWSTQLATLREWKASGRIRYSGITHYRVDAYDDLERIIRAEKPDFVQLNFSILTRAAERRLLPFAADRGVAVIINRPYEGGSLFRMVRGHEVPAWAAEFDCDSWGQFFLKYILSEPNVTCVIPATSNPDHLVDNMGAGYGRLPDAATRERMVRHLESL